MTDAYRACPLCGTRNTYYMLVCRHCGRSLRRVALVGTPPTGTVRDETVGRGVRRVLGAVALLAAAAAVAVAVRFLRTAPFEGAAAAAAPVRKPISDPAAWETLEQRLAQLPPVPTPSALPVASAAPPPSAPPATVPPTTLAPATPPPAAPPPPRPRATAPARDAKAEERLERDVRTARRAALRQAEDRVRTLERRASALRERLREDELGGEERVRLEDELASASLQLEDAERELIRAEWALRAVEE